MLTAAELTPHLVAATPRLAALVPWLLAWGVTVIVLALAASVFIARGAARMTNKAARADSPAGGSTIFGDAARRLRRARRLLLVALGCVLALWGVLGLADRADPLLTELIFGVLVAGILGPISIATRILEGAMTRAAARGQGARENRPHHLPGEGRGRRPDETSSRRRP